MTILEALKARRTIRLFKQAAVSSDDLRDMLDAARQTSCACNGQLLRYVVVKSSDDVKKVFEQTAWAGLVKPRRTPVWGVSAPAAFIAVIGPAEAGSMTYADAGAAIQSMQITAYEKGLGCCWLGAINRQNLHGILGLAEKQQVLFLLAVGVPDEQPVSEDITDPKDVNYYLDDANRLHIPKLTVDAITKWL